MKVLKILFFFIIFFSFSKNILSTENKIIFKIDKNAYTSYDYENRVKYLDFVGDNEDLTKEIIIEDLISVSLFFEYYKNLKNKNNFDKEINKIYENIKKNNIENNKKYKYKLEKKNILFNIKIDLVRKNILENLLNEKVDEINRANNETDLLYKYKIKYINFEVSKTSNLRNKINDMKNIDFENILLLLNKNNVEFFVKEKIIDNFSKINPVLKFNIISNKNNFIVDNNNKLSIVFIEKKFQTFDGIIVQLYSVKSTNEIDIEKLKCENLKNIKNSDNVFSKEYKFLDLRNDLKKRLVSIDDYFKFTNNNEDTYVVLCNIKFDKKILNNVKMNNLVNVYIDKIENDFIKKYSKIFNLLIINA